MNDEARALQLFQEGTAALRKGDMPAARARLSESARLYPHPATAFNLAVAMKGMGDAVAALEQLEPLAEGKLGALPVEQQKQVRELLASLRGQTADVQLQLVDAKEVEVAIDAVPAGRLQRNAAHRMRVNPGRRVFEFSANGYSTQVRDLVVGKGETAELHVAMGAPLALLRPPVAASKAEVTAPPWYRRTWFYVAASTVVVVAATGAYLLLQPNEPQRDPVFGVTQTLRVP